jgi:hypothetical protein
MAWDKLRGSVVSATDPRVPTLDNHPHVSKVTQTNLSSPAGSRRTYGSPTLPALAMLFTVSWSNLKRKRRYTPLAV